MNPIYFLKELFNTYRKQERYKDRQMKRVFQWRRYLEWKELSQEEKLFAKRLLFVLIATYFVFTFLNQHSLTLVFLISLYFLYKKFEKGKLMK